LIQSPAFEVITAKEKFENPTKRVNEMWQTDFTQFLVVDWGLYVLRLFGHILNGGFPPR